ncbi:hypothetical protein Tco_0092593 [Tanacetum coccineum]
MPYPRFTKIIINHFLKQHKSFSNLKYQHYHTIKDDGIVSRLKFVRIGEDYREYGLEIPDVMLNDTIKRSESYQMFIKYSTGQIPPRRAEGKVHKKKTANRIVVKKKVTLSANDNIIPDDPDIALELGKSISLTEAEEAEATRKVHATHARIVTESAKKKSGGRSSRGVSIQDTPIAPKPKPATLKPKLKGAQSLTLAEKEQEDKKETTSTKLEVPDEENNIFEEKVILKWGSKQESEYLEKDLLNEEKDDKDGDSDDEGDDHISDTHDADNEDTKTESNVDEIYKYKIHVHKDVYVEMAEPETGENEKKQKEEMTDAAKLDVEKSAEKEGDAEKVVSSNFLVKESTKFPSLSSSLLVLSSFARNSLNPVSISTEGSRISDFCRSRLIPETTNLPPIPEILTKTAVLESDALSAVQLRVAKLEKDMSELKKIDLSAKDLAALKTQVSYQIPKLPKNQTPTIDLEQESEKSPSEILKIKKQQAEKQKTLKFTIKSTDKAALK